MKANKIVVGVDINGNYCAAKYDNKSAVYDLLKNKICDEQVLFWGDVVEENGLSTTFDIHLLAEEKYVKFVNSFKGIVEIIQLV